MEAVLSFILVIGVLIVVHEMGHFLVARKFGVKIEKFSIGFGPKIFSRTVGETEYRLAWIPLGGYVKMLGENDPEQVSPEERDRSFSALPVSKRMAIAAAGPVANFILAFFCLPRCSGSEFRFSNRLWERFFPSRRPRWRD